MTRSKSRASKSRVSLRIHRFLKRRTERSEYLEWFRRGGPSATDTCHGARHATVSAGSTLRRSHVPFSTHLVTPDVRYGLDVKTYPAETVHSRHHDQNSAIGASERPPGAVDVAQTSSFASIRQQTGVALSSVYRMFHGMDGDCTQPQATLVFGENGLCRWVSNELAFATFFPGAIYTMTINDIAHGMNSRKFLPVPADDPEYLDALETANDSAYVWEASVRATEAAADFLRAVWELRRYMSGGPPRMLATHLQRNPTELQGDDDLPDHIEAAADMLSALPRAVIDWGASEHYDGKAQDFLLDAERIFKNVSARLRRLSQERDGPA